MTIIKKTLSVFITLSLVLTMGIAAFATGGGTVVSLNLSIIDNDTLSVSGSTTNVTSAVFVQVLSDENIIASQTFTIDGNGNYSGSIDTIGYNLNAGDYSVIAADLDGGPWIKTAIESEIKTAGYNIFLEGYIGVNYWVRLDNSLKNDPNTKVTFTYDSTLDALKTQTSVIDTSNTIEKDGVTYYGFFCKVDPSELTMPITAVLTGGEETATLKTINARDVILKYVGDEDVKLDNLAKALLNYGYYAQAKYAPNSTRYEEDKYIDLDNITGLPTAAEAVRIATPDGIEYYGSSVIFISGNRIRCYFYKSDEEVTYTVNNKVCEPVASGSSYEYIYTDELSILDLERANTIDVNGVQSSYSVRNYIAGILKKDPNTLSPYMQELVKSLYVYYTAARAYKG